MGPFTYQDCAKPLEQSVPLPSAKYFGDIDPQPDCVITTEIASGRFEDDIRRMRMAAWHGADHLMVIRTAGQPPVAEGQRLHVHITRDALHPFHRESGRRLDEPPGAREQAA